MIANILEFKIFLLTSILEDDRITEIKWFKVDEQNSTLGRYITESQRWWELVWSAFRNGFGRCKGELTVACDVDLTL